MAVAERYFIAACLQGGALSLSGRRGSAAAVRSGLYRERFSNGWGIADDAGPAHWLHEELQRVPNEDPFSVEGDKGNVRVPGQCPFLWRRILCRWRPEID
jgi:hypothetical protein